jgi:hypothetical protein
MALNGRYKHFEETEHYDTEEEAIRQATIAAMSYIEKGEV